MPRILSPTELEAKDIPDSTTSIKEAARASEQILDYAHKKGDVVSATSYGSIYASGEKLHITSDIDWLIVFDSLKAMIESPELAELTKLMESFKIPFTSPVLSSENVKIKNHLIAPILYGIKQTQGRFIVGEDPVSYFLRNGVKSNDIEIISHIFASHLRYLFEDVACHYSQGINDDAILVKLIQKTVDYFLGMYRTMIVLAQEDHEPSNALTYKGYLSLYQQKIHPDFLQRGLEVHTFINKYKRLINDLFRSPDGLITNKTSIHKRDASKYVAFLQKNTKLILSSVLFCQKNIEYFKAHITNH